MPTNYSCTTSGTAGPGRKVNIKQKLSTLKNGIRILGKLKKKKKQKERLSYMFSQNTGGYLDFPEDDYNTKSIRDIAIQNGTTDIDNISDVTTEEVLESDIDELFNSMEINEEIPEDAHSYNVETNNETTKNPTAELLEIKPKEAPPQSSIKSSKNQTFDTPVTKNNSNDRKFTFDESSSTIKKKDTPSPKEPEKIVTTTTTPKTTKTTMTPKTDNTTRRVSDRAVVLETPTPPVAKLKNWLVEFERSNVEHYEKNIVKRSVAGRFEAPAAMAVVEGEKNEESNDNNPYLVANLKNWLIEFERSNNEHYERSIVKRSEPKVQQRNEAVTNTKRTIKGECPVQS